MPAFLLPLRNPLGSPIPILQQVYHDRADLNGQLPRSPGIVPILLDQVQPLHQVIAVDLWLPGMLALSITQLWQSTREQADEFAADILRNFTFVPAVDRFPIGILSRAIGSRTRTHRAGTDRPPERWDGGGPQPRRSSDGGSHWKIASSSAPAITVWSAPPISRAASSSCRRAM